MLNVRIYSPADLTEQVCTVLREEPSVSSLAVIRGAGVLPPGDLVLAAVSRETANDVIDKLRLTGVHRAGSVQIEPVRTWLSKAGYDAEVAAPGSSTDAVVWAEVVRQAYGECELSFSFFAFMIMATLIAGIGIILDSQILVIGAMVLGPEFGAVAALGVALVRRRPALLRHGVRALVAGFAVAIAATTLVTLAGRALGWVTRLAVTGPRPGTSFVYHPDRWSVVVALIAGAAGVLAMTSGRQGGLVGVFISVTTIPAAGNMALALAFADFAEVRGSALQLVINLTGMALAGWATLALQQRVWQRVSAVRRRRAAA